MAKSLTLIRFEPFRLPSLKALACGSLKERISEYRPNSLMRVNFCAPPRVSRIATVPLSSASTCLLRASQIGITQRRSHVLTHEHSKSLLAAAALQCCSSKIDYVKVRNTTIY